MTYKLKEHVTDEMLKAVGFEVENRPKVFKDAIRYNDVEDHEIYIVLENKNTNYRLVEFNDMGVVRDGEDITPYIQDIIALGYVEEVN